MDATIKAQWVAALRSGEYEQGTGYLNSDDKKFCCLGVLCELAAEAGIVRKQIPTEIGPIGYGSETGTLPATVKDWSGLRDGVGAFDVQIEATGEYFYAWLTTLNDDGMTFDQIADVIEAFF
jgi:hypothetical protein